jgi:hypothetical protein
MSQVVITVDASSLNIIGQRMGQVALLTPRMLDIAVHQDALARRDAIKNAAPERAGADHSRDTRITNRGKLKNSFDVVKVNIGEYQVITTREEKYNWVTLGTPPHAIYPKTKKALWWPGLPHPIAYVDGKPPPPHPGNRPNPFATDAMSKYNMTTIVGGTNQPIGQLLTWMASGIIGAVGGILSIAGMAILGPISSLLQWGASDSDRGGNQ